MTRQVLQLAVSLTLGAAVGLERELRGRPAGLRTLSLVSFGATLIMLIPTLHPAGLPTESLRVDPGRIAAGVVMGIGFLGGGVILKHAELVSGVTTAASIWVVAAIGLTVGTEEYALATIATAMALGVLTLVNSIERHIPGTVYRQLVIRTAALQSRSVLASAVEGVRHLGGRILDVRLSEHPARKRTDIEVRIGVRRGESPVELVHRLASLEGVTEVRWR
jgi:putative Mg2+ transporter-C (MgtC) family protein